MPAPVHVTAEFYILVLFLAGVFLLGMIVSWFFFRVPRHQNPSTAIDDVPVDLYPFFGRITHQVKTMGEVIRGHLRRFTDELPDDAERWRVARRAIMEETSGIEPLLNRLNLVVRLGMTEQPLIMEPTNIALLLENKMMHLAPAAEEKGIVLSSSVSKDIPLVSADSFALEEVFSYLLENALKHNDAGTEVTTEVEQRDDRIWIRIADNGIGIPEDIQQVLFEPGGGSSSPRLIEGTGMGLYLSKLLVELHGGQINVCSAPGEGTTFEIDLPLRRIN